MAMLHFCFLCGAAIPQLRDELDEPKVRDLGTIRCRLVRIGQLELAGWCFPPVARRNACESNRRHRNLGLFGATPMNGSQISALRCSRVGSKFGSNLPVLLVAKSGLNGVESTKSNKVNSRMLYH